MFICSEESYIFSIFYSTIFRTVSVAAFAFTKETKLDYCGNWCACVSEHNDKTLFFRVQRSENQILLAKNQNIKKKQNPIASDTKCRLLTFLEKRSDESARAEPQFDQCVCVCVLMCVRCSMLISRRDVWLCVRCGWL